MKAIRGLGWGLLSLGGLVLAFLAYQLFGTDLVAARSQAVAETELAIRFEEVREQLPSSTTTTTAAAVTIPPPPSLLEEPPAIEGQPFGRMVIERIGVDEVVFEGVDRATLKKGPGHMPWTPLPGQPGNAVISGHRTTYGRPFYDLDVLEVGDEIIVETVLGEHVYTVRETIVVAPTDVWVTDPRLGGWLTLTTCHPRFSARQRLVVFAELTEGPNLAFVASLDSDPTDLAA